MATAGVSKMQIDMRERRADTGISENLRASATTVGAGSSEPRGAIDAAEERRGRDWRSESAPVENTVRLSGAHELASDAGVSKPLASTQRAMPPRPANFPPIPKVASWSRPVKEQPKPWNSASGRSKPLGVRSEPPGGSTRAYDHTELAQLLTTAGSLPSSLPPGPGALGDTMQLDDARRQPDAGDSIAPMEPAPSPTESLFPALHDTVHERDAATTAYLHSSARGMLDETVSLEERQCWATASLADEKGSDELSSLAADDGTVALAPSAELRASPRRRPGLARRRLARIRKANRTRYKRLAWGIAVIGLIGISCATWGYAHLAERSPVSMRLRGALARLGGAYPSSRAAALGETPLVQVDVAVEPPSAQLYLDGRAASNPLKVSYPADQRAHEITAAAPGYERRSHRIRLDRDVVVLFGLAPIASPSSPKPP